MKLALYTTIRCSAEYNDCTASAAETSLNSPLPSREGLGVRANSMDNDVMDLKQLAAYLHRDVREVSKLANRGRLPGKKVGGQWRFASAEINYWMETQLPALTDEE